MTGREKATLFPPRGSRVHLPGNSHLAHQVGDMDGEEVDAKGSKGRERSGVFTDQYWLCVYPVPTVVQKMHKLARMATQTSLM